MNHQFIKARELIVKAREALRRGDKPVARQLGEQAALLMPDLEDVWLVLDDYHLVADPRVDQGIAFLLEHLPPNVHVVLSTRADPDLPLARWRSRGELVEIRA